MGLTVPGQPWDPPSSLTGAAGPVLRPQIAATAAATGPDGLPRIEWREPSGSAAYLTRITVSCSVESSAYLYVGDVSRACLVSGTRAGRFDENDTSQPIYVPEGTPVFVCWDKEASDALARFEYFTIG